MNKGIHSSGGAARADRDRQTRPERLSAEEVRSLRDEAGQLSAWARRQLDAKDSPQRQVQED